VRASKYFPPPSPAGTAPRLRAAVARIDRLLAREVLGSALTRTQFSVLGALARQGRLRLSDLADREGLNPTMLSRVVGVLERYGWVERAPDPSDGRAALAGITAEGRQRYEQLQAERSGLIQDYLDGLAAADAARLAAALPLLEGLADHLREHHRTGAGAAR
jgi:DNA-binding MarR family transcriptional regulator